MAIEALRRRARLALVAAWACGAAGCGGEPGPDVVISRRPVPVEDLPPAVAKGARRALPGVTLREAWKNPDKDGAAVSFEVRGSSRDGKIRDVKVTPAGEVLDSE